MVFLTFTTISYGTKEQVTFSGYLWQHNTQKPFTINFTGKIDVTDMSVWNYATIKKISSSSSSNSWNNYLEFVIRKQSFTIGGKTATISSYADRQLEGTTPDKMKFQITFYSSIQ